MRDPTRSVVIHAHFYQPPREDPWLDEVPRQPTAAPFHDWNARIERECYRAVTAARLLGPDGRIARIVNTLEHVSFDAGPTLMAWLARAAPDTYRRFVAADRASVERLGRGNAIAAPYHHVILPLSDRRDKRTEVLWGLADFRARFGRDPEGCWLPETAVDDETLDVLAECGLTFTVLAPHQVKAAPPRGRPGRVRTAAGRALTVLIYDGPLSHDVAFGPLVRDAGAWSAAVRAVPSDLVAIATDGETYGHHHRFGEMALAAVVSALEADPHVRVENFGSYLAREDRPQEVTLQAPSSWSCAHGVERWRADCGCRLDAQRWPSQAWRGPLRAGLATLQRALHALYEAEGSTLFRDAWAARDAYGTVLSGATDLGTFLDAWLQQTGAPARARAAALLAMERHTLGMLTSCGWFFDDVSGLESIQVLRYAARAIELAGPDGAPLERELLTHLRKAASNDPAVGTAADLYTRSVLPLRPAAPRVAGGVAAALAVGATVHVPAAYEVERTDGALRVRHRRTGEDTLVRVTAERGGPGRVALRLEDGTPLSLAALPDAARMAVTDRLRREVMALWLTDDESAALAVGAPLADVLDTATARAIRSLPDDPSAIAAAQVLDLLDLLELCELPVPFDAQTAFADLRAQLGASPPAQVEAIGRRLGFG